MGVKLGLSEQENKECKFVSKKEEVREGWRKLRKEGLEAATSSSIGILL
jgi:hypothetical protein